ncbi:DUF685 domain-containing protein [Borreliella bavariensis]|uniref:DUF685 domain-containing protein n=1 Tax=Borreliella bavariensis TaxID=664662 RepID=UPI001C003A31|nr:DUF685 domain-containing protein [Borreliella bavariensis]
MAGEEEKLLIDEEETVQIKDLNKVTTVNNNDLLLLDDGVASSNAITFKNFLKTVNHQTFKGEELGYFKEIIKSTIAEELAADEKFVEKIYNKITNKLINNDSTKIVNLYHKIKSYLESGMPSVTIASRDDLLIMSYSTNTIQKTPVPRQLLGLPSEYLPYRQKTLGTTFYPYEYKGNLRTINMDDYGDVTLICNKSLDDIPTYLDIDIDIEHPNNGSKSLYLRYSDEDQKNLVYLHKGASSISIRVPMYKGWYVQKRSSSSGSPIPFFCKL